MQMLEFHPFHFTVWWSTAPFATRIILGHLFTAGHVCFYVCFFCVCCVCVCPFEQGHPMLCAMLARPLRITFIIDGSPMHQTESHPPTRSHLIKKVVLEWAPNFNTEPSTLARNEAVTERERYQWLHDLNKIYFDVYSRPATIEMCAVCVCGDRRGVVKGSGTHAHTPA